MSLIRIAGRPRLARRTFLRGLLGGAAVAVGMPVLETMLNDNGTALADGGTLPRRFGVFSWGCGVVPGAWVPSKTGTGFDLSDSLSPFGGLQDYLTVVSGTNHATSDPGHIPARGIALSSSHDMTTGIPGGGAYRGQAHPEPSVDALVVESWTGKTAFDSVSIGICQRGPYQGNSSWKRGGAAFNGAELSPVNLYNQLFSMGIGDKDPELLKTTTTLELSMLDAVKQDGDALRTRLGASDRIRLDQHLDGVRAVELRLQKLLSGAGSACTSPTAPMQQDFGDGSPNEQKEDKSILMSDLLAIALACDLTRVFSYEWSANQSGAVYWEVGVSEEHHQLTHDDPTGQGVRDITRFIMKNLAYLADRLRQTPDGAGNLLDNTLILGTSEHATAGYHDYVDHPLVLVGKAGGGIKAGQHVRVTAQDNLDAPKVLLTAVRAVGVEADHLGQADSDAPRLVTDSISELVP